jgi:hypothetical protein
VLTFSCDKKAPQGFWISVPLSACMAGITAVVATVDFVVWPLSFRRNNRTMARVMVTQVYPVFRVWHKRATAGRVMNFMIAV